MATKKKGRRARSPHPGVILRSRTWDSGEVTWFARYVDPDKLDDKGRPKQVDENLTKIGRTSHEMRVAWAKAKSKVLLARAAELASGAPRRTETPLAQAVADYIDHIRATRREGTAKAYAPDARRFAEWAQRQGVRLAEQLTDDRLVAFRDQLVRTAPRAAKEGGKKGENKARKGRLKPATINTRLRHLRSLVDFMRKRKLAPRLSKDAIKDALEMETIPRDPPNAMRPADLRALLRAALAHDEATFDLTREEKDRGLTKGATPRYQPVAPLLTFCLLTGCRIGEATSLAWANVSLEGAGWFRVSSLTAKTNIGRDVPLNHIPAVLSLLKALHVRSGGTGLVFTGWTRPALKAVRRRLVSEYDAPRFTFSSKSDAARGTLRSTAVSYFTHAPGILGSASPWEVVRIFGHDPVTARRFYMGSLEGVDPKATTLEAAMGVAPVVRDVVRRVTGGRRTAKGGRRVVSA